MENYSRETWKAERDLTIDQLMESYYQVNKNIQVDIIRKGITRQFDERFATEDKKKDFLENPSVTLEDLFYNNRVSNKTGLVDQVVNAGILPEDIATTMTGKQLKALMDNYNKD